jgi:hypothetical protein
MLETKKTKKRSIFLRQIIKSDLFFKLNNKIGIQIIKNGLF